MLNKRFIAGVRCPGCGALDTLRLWREDQGLRQDCVACNYQQQLDAGRSGQGQTATRSIRIRQLDEQQRIEPADTNAVSGHAGAASKPSR